VRNLRRRGQLLNLPERDRAVEVVEDRAGAVQPAWPVLDRLLGVELLADALEHQLGDRVDELRRQLQRQVGHAGARPVSTRTISS